MLLLGGLSALAILLDVLRRPQPMAIMNLVWPITGLYAGPLALWAYQLYGRPPAETSQHTATIKTRKPTKADGVCVPFFAKVGKGALHCGAGCTLGDILAELLAYFAPTVIVWLGYNSYFGEKIFAIWILDYILALLIGIAFQYASIMPMRHLSPGRGIIEAVKADVLSLSAWQVGMYGFMELMHFGLFAAVLGTTLSAGMPEFWASMQLAMIAGLVTAYPMNWWLIRRGIKHAM